MVGTMSGQIGTPKEGSTANSVQNWFQDYDENTGRIIYYTRRDHSYYPYQKPLKEDCQEIIRVWHHMLRLSMRASPRSAKALGPTPAPIAPPSPPPDWDMPIGYDYKSGTTTSVVVTTMQIEAAAGAPEEEYIY